MSQLKRYLVFGGNEYYPAGGWDDLKNSFDTDGEAESYCHAAYVNGNITWWMVIDLTTGDKVSSRG